VLGIAERDLLEIFVDRDYIMLQKYSPDHPSCVFCGNLNDILLFKNRHICGECASELG
jgi:transcriptional pleiotropic regulator of transition state genes